MLNTFITGKEKIERKLKNMTLQSTNPATSQKVFEDPETLTQWVYLECQAKNDKEKYSVLMRIPEPTAEELGRIALDSASLEQSVVSAILLAQQGKSEYRSAFLKQIEQKVKDLEDYSAISTREKERLQQVISASCLDELMDDSDSKGEFTPLKKRTQALIEKIS